MLGMALTACTGGGPAGVERIAAVRTIPTGPAADYPVVIGEPFTVDGVTYTPDDTLNYDRVGYAMADTAADATGVTAAHRTLPLPSYIEVTSLESGRTILARVERRGPMTNDRLLALAPAAMAQLGIADGDAIRMRRVNPPEAHRAELRQGRAAPLRMDTPQGLLDVLKRRLPESGSASLRGHARVQPVTVPVISSVDPDAEAAEPVEPAPAAAESAEQPAAASPEPAPDSPIEEPLREEMTAAQGRFVVQIGAFSVRANADRLAKEVGGHVARSGSLNLVRVGPFANRGQAQDALAKLRTQGYSDALIDILR